MSNSKILTGIISLLLLNFIALNAQELKEVKYKNQKFPEKLLVKISVNLDEVPFEKALEIIAEKGNIKLNYNRNRIPVNKKVSVKMKNKETFKVLMKVLNITGTCLKVTPQGQLAIIPFKKGKSEIKGKIISKNSREPLIGANVLVTGTTIGSSSGQNGDFVISHLSAGVYSIEASMMGFEKKTIENIVVAENESVEVHIELADTLLSLKEIIVTPGHFSLMEKEPASSKALKAEDIRSFPQLGEDIFRAINRLPGVAGSDISAKFTIRGGEYDEVLVMLDGMELYDPFHLKDLDGFLSIIDVEAIRSIDMVTGAFPAEYGNRLSGVFNMKTVNPTLDKPRTSLAISFMNARFLSEGNFNNGRGQWLFLARRGYMDLLLKWLTPEDKVIPVYYDVLNKIRYTINSKHSISANILISRDDVWMKESDDDAEIKSGYGNAYGWLNWYAQFHPGLLTQTVLSFGRVDKDASVKEVPEEDIEFKGEVTDKRYFNFTGFKQDWSYELSKNYFLKWGYEMKQLFSDYNYFFKKRIILGYEDENEIYSYDTTVYKGDPDGNQASCYLGNRFRLLPYLALELGIRYDYASWTQDKNWSPRINVVYDVGENTVFRAGWGHFYQTQNIYSHHAQDGEEQYYPAELAEHRMIGLEHEFSQNINLRVETYYKKLSSLRPSYHNFKGFTLNPFAELHNDRYRLEPESGESKGFEIYLKNDTDRKFSWWASYGYAIAQAMIDGIKTPRDFDQHHTVYLDFNYKPNKKWRINLAWQYHSGWPFTESKIIINNQWPDGYIDYDWIPGKLNANRLPAYHRMDVRANRDFKTSHGRISAFFEIRNFYNHHNIREYIYEFKGVQNGEAIVERTGNERFLPLLPSFGISWEF